MSITEINQKYPLYVFHMVEDDEHYIEITKAVCKMNGLPNIVPFRSLDEIDIHNGEGLQFDDPELYEKYLQANPNLTVHFAVIDKRFDSGVDGLDIAYMLHQRCRRKRVKTQTIMITGSPAPQTYHRFYYECRGHCLLDKNQRTTFERDFKQALQSAIENVIEIYEDLALWEDLKIEVEETEKAKSIDSGQDQV